MYIIGCIAIIWVSLMLLFNIVIYIIQKLTRDCEYISIVRNTYFSDNEFGTWYLIPTIGFNLENKREPYFEVIWLKWTFSVYYRIKTEKDEIIEFKAKQIIEQK